MSKNSSFDIELDFSNIDLTQLTKNKWKIEEEFQKVLPPSDKDIPPMVKALGKSSDHLTVGLDGNNVQVAYYKGKLSEYAIGNIIFEYGSDGTYTKKDRNNNHSVQYSAEGVKVKETMEDVVFTFSDGKITNIDFLDDYTRARLAKLTEDVKTADNVDKYREPQNSSSAQFSPLEKIFIDRALKIRDKQASQTLNRNTSHESSL